MSTTTTLPSVSLTEIIITPGASAANLKHGPIKSMTHQNRYALRQGPIVQVVATNPSNTGQRTVIGTVPIRAVRAAFTVIDQQLTTLESNGVNLKDLTRIVVPVTSPNALKEIVQYLGFNIVTAKGALGEMKQPKAHALYTYMITGEAAVAVGFKHILDMMKGRIDRTMYRGQAIGIRYQSPTQRLFGYTTPILLFTNMWKLISLLQSQRHISTETLRTTPAL